MMEPIVPQIREFVDALAIPGRIYEVRCFRRGGMPPTPRFFVAGDEAEELVEHLADRAASGRECYIGPNPRDREEGTAEAVSEAICLFADDDRLQPPEFLELVELSGLPEPSIVVASGHGTHAYWRLAEPIPVAAWVPLQRGLAELLGTDHVHDAPRMMRVPGTANLKDPGAPVMARLVRAIEGEDYEPDDLPIEPVSDERPAITPDVRKALERSRPHQATQRFVKQGVTGLPGNDGRRRAAWNAAVDLWARGYSVGEIEVSIQHGARRAGLDVERELPGMLRRLELRHDWSPRLTTGERAMLEGGSANGASEAAGAGDEAEPSAFARYRLKMPALWRPVGEGVDREPLELPPYVMHGINRRGMLTRGSRIVVGGVPGAGKTALLVNWIDYMLAREPERKCLWLTFDMSGRRLVDRFQQVTSKRTLRSLRSTPTAPPMPSYSDRLEFVEEIIPASMLGGMHDEEPFDYLVIDLLQDLEVVESENRVVAQDRALQEASRFLAARPGVTLFATSEAGKTGGRRFDVEAALRGSRKIQHWADVIYVGQRVYPNPDHPEGEGAAKDEAEREGLREGEAMVRWHCAKARDFDASEASFSAVLDGPTQRMTERVLRHPAGVPT